MNAGTVFLFLLGIMRGLSFPTGCAVDEWQCSNGACIQLTSKCDNFPDCSDGSDEQKCTVAPVCLEGLESCPQPNGTTICVEKAVGCGCGLAPYIAHGVISSISNTIGSSANVTCDAGYETATESILCQDTGIWETAFCSPNDCGPVEKIQYGTIYLSDINNTTFGASGSVVCDEGYETLTPITTCRKNGKWDSVICTRIDCGPPPAISFGNITLDNDNNSTFGAIARVTCVDNYAANTSTVTCKASGEWEQASCTSTGCGPASKILHGTITSKDKSSSGTSANVTCDPGYKANISTVTCKSSGEWESAKCSAIDCGSVPVIVLGKITLVDLNNATYGASANITCDTGYTANVSAVSCQSSGVWETAICKAIDCGPVPEISFGTTKLIDEFNTTYGASAYLTCDTGFETNVSNITCQSSGLWETAVCKAKDCGPVPVVPFGRVSLIDNVNTTYGASANVTCETGFETSDLKIKCQSSGIWQTVICKSIDCGPVPAIAFGTTKLIDENNTTYGASAYLTCDTGFETNILNITCQSSGLWETAVCKAKDCGPVPEIAFGTTTLIDDNNTTYGASAYLTCDTGFETNVSDVMCQNSGLWETATGPVPVVPFGRVSLIDDGNTTYGASANVICEAGFETNDLKIKCQRSGIWQTAFCKAIDCGSPPAISFGNISLNADNNSTVGATAFVNCNENYVASRPKITCQSTGVWENVTCFSKGCSSIPTISNGKITVTGTTSVGSFANVTCDVGYEASVSSIKCQISRIWETAECKIKACGRVPAIKHGKVNLIDSFHTSVGDSANVVCDTGYETSKTKVACQSSGVWETALCTAKDCGPPPVISNGNITLRNDKMSTYGAEALVNCNDKYVANVSKIKCQSSGLWEVAQCAPEGQLNYDRCTEEHGVCTQHIYENIRLLALKSSKCRSFCHCAHAGTLIDGSVTYKWVERNCPQGTLFDDNLPSPVCNHPYMVWC